MEGLDLFEPGASSDLSDDFTEIASQLRKAIEWAVHPQPEAEPERIDIELLEALEKLVPRQSGIIESVEARGRIFRNGQKRYTLTRESSRRVVTALRKARAVQERICSISGVIPEMDKDNYTFTLRGTEDGREHLCTFPPDLMDEVLLAFNTDKRVTVSGRETLNNGNIEVSIIATTAEQPPA